MQLPLQITFHGIDRSVAIEAAIREKAAKLEQFHPRIMSCAVVVEVPNRHKHKGKEFVVRIDLKVPGGEIAVNHGRHQDVQVALRDAFAAVRRQLEDALRRRRGEVKLHEPEFTGRVARIFPEDGCGFIETADGRELYFSRENVVVPSFEQLTVGTEVHFLEEAVAEGLHAKRISARKSQSA